MSEPSALCLLADLGALRLRGSDVRSFLQGQVSSDVAQLAPGAIQRSGLHNPQGRTLALLWLIAQDEQEVLAVLPRELTATIGAQLRRYVLRAKVTISDESDALKLYGRHGEAGSGSAATEARYDAQRTLIVDASGLRRNALMTRERWRALDIAAGLPQVYAATSGQFVAQMLNLDCIEAVAFDKGCYTGQEVIARAHYRGQVKRRMQRLVTQSRVQLTPGTQGQLTDGRTFRVVESTQRADGGCEFLAVAALIGSASEAAGIDGGGAAGVLNASALPLPYSLPE